MVQNKTKMIYFSICQKNLYSAKKEEGHQGVSCPHVPVIISLKGLAWVLKTSLFPPLSIEVTVPN